ncbi:MAG TPA: DNA ligase D [Kiloniellales bacterium]|nr:DNA ligase D [Kiloniellales bacterium]
MVRDKLERYRSMRDFGRTSEPAGGPGTGEGFFIVQKHDATRLHYDFRLAHDGVLLSWAVTKGPSLDPADKRLAVRTEDHPLDYAEFEGTIPKGAYGGGTVMLWDRGAYRPLEDLDKGLKDGKIKVQLEGERLRGGFALVRMRGKRGDKRENWLLIKEKDEEVRDDWDPAAFTTSIASGRKMPEIAEGRPAKKGRSKVAKTDKTVRKSKLPDFISPQLATLAEEAPEGEEWVHEIKYDGYRLMAAVSGTQVRLYTRSGQDWTHRFGSVAADLAKRDLQSCLLDGEVVVAGSGGRSDFGELQRVLRDGSGAFAYFLFDLLHLDEEDLRKLPLLERKERLRNLLVRRRDSIRYSDHEQGRGDRVAQQACRLGLEGIISKRADSPYRSTRNRDWLKVKCVRRQEFVIGGWTPSTKNRSFASLILGVWTDDGLLYRGRVGTGFDVPMQQELSKLMQAREQAKSPFLEVPRDIRRRAKWCKPEIVVEVNYTEITRDGSIRHGVFMGLREDKPAESVTMEKPVPPPEQDKKKRRASDLPAGVTLTNADRVLFPQMGITKRDLADYLLGVAPRMLPHLEGRPVSLVRCPQGRAKTCFFQKHAGKGFPSQFGAIAIQEKKGGSEDYLLVESEAALAASAQVGVLEFHVWGSRKDDIERPDRIVFDLDPDEAVPFSQVRQAAQELAAILAEGGLKAFPMATGGKGLHLVVPLVRRHPWPIVSGFTKAFSEKVAELDPQRFVATMSKAKRKGRIFIDHFRNQRGSTAIAPYSPRAREGAPVAMPLDWNELPDLAAANLFSFSDALARLDEKDPWGDYMKTRQSLTAKKLKRIGLEDSLSG